MLLSLINPFGWLLVLKIYPCRVRLELWFSFLYSATFAFVLGFLCSGGFCYCPQAFSALPSFLLLLDPGWVLLQTNPGVAPSHESSLHLDSFCLQILQISQKFCRVEILHYPVCCNCLDFKYVVCLDVLLPSCSLQCPLQISRCTLLQMLSHVEPSPSCIPGGLLAAQFSGQQIREAWIIAVFAFRSPGLSIAFLLHVICRSVQPLDPGLSALWFLVQIF